MELRITVGPPAITINRSSTFMVTDQSGGISADKAQGVFAEDTRFVSSYCLRLNGQPWQRVSAAAVSYDQAKLYLTNPEIEPMAGFPGLEASTLGLEIVRTVEEGIHEGFRITNYSQRTVSSVLELELASDFADLFEVKSKAIRERANVVTQWDRKRQELTTTYQHKDFLRRFTYRVSHASPPPSYANGRLLFPLILEPGACWKANGYMILQSNGKTRRPRPRQMAKTPSPTYEVLQHNRWVKDCTAIETSYADLKEAFDQSVSDMGALRLYERDLRPDVWVPAAGVPWFVTLFGRDSLVASLENLLVYARFAEGALRTLARYQATERDDWRDAQPGKIMHEIRYGELAHFNLVPQTPYYGTWDATPLYLIVLHQAWRWLGDRKLIEDLRETADRCLHWIDHYGDLDGDGFQEYQTFSSRGFEDMSWKDSGHAVVYPDGTEVKQPKALCELQGYVYAAKRGMAEVYAALGEHEKSELLRSQAADLKRRFNEHFWMEDLGTYAYALDPDKHQVKSIVSNPGHCLWTGIVDESRAPRVVQRLLAPDMWSGWGVRTLSRENPAYNPFSYQRGSVWPHDNGIIASGMKRYGFHREANQVAQGIIDAASHFEGRRLPEVFSGLDREPLSFPVQYRGANTPQAWAAGSIFLFVRMMLGLDADVPSRRLWVDPSLPDWLPSLDLVGLMVGPQRLHLRFWREGPDTRFQLVNQRGDLPIDVKLMAHHVQPESGQPEVRGSGKTSRS